MNDMQTIVVKYGGAAMQTAELSSEIMADAIELLASGVRLVIVHGGGPDLSALQKRLGMETRFVDGLRYTDEATMEAALMSLAGKVNKTLVRHIQTGGGKAVGISGIDGGLLICEKKKEPDLGFVGEISRVNAEPAELLLGGGFIPVISTIGLGEDGEIYNINADTAAGKIAAALGADKFIILSDIPGVLGDKDDPESLIEEIRLGEIDGLIGSGVVSGGMIPKVKSAAEVVSSGVDEVIIADGRKHHALALVVSKKEKCGTVISK